MRTERIHAGNAASRHRVELAWTWLHALMPAQRGMLADRELTQTPGPRTGSVSLRLPGRFTA